MPRGLASLLVVSLGLSIASGCATRSSVEAKASAADPPASPTKAIAPPPAKPTPPAAVPAEPPAAVAESVVPPAVAPEAEAALAVLRVEAGALVTRVNGDPRLACTNPDCRIPLPPGTHRFTVGYKEAATRAGTGVTFASLRSREIEVTLEPGHSYSVSASGKSTPEWWVAVEDHTANKIVYDDRVPRPD